MALNLQFIAFFFRSATNKTAPAKRTETATTLKLGWERGGITAGHSPHGSDKSFVKSK